MGHYDSCRDAADAIRDEEDAGVRAALGMAYQRKIADHRPVEVHELISQIHQHIQNLDDKVVGREGMASLTEIDFLFRALYTGRSRSDFK